MYGRFLSFLLILCWTNSKAQSPIKVARLEGAITIDGISNEPAWSRVTPINFFALRPVYGQQPMEKSELLLTYDDKYLYVAARLYYKDSATIVARNFVRDGYRGDDWFAFDVDARNDKQNAMRFALYPFGTHFDMAISNDAVELGNATFNTNYNLIWDGKSKLTKDGWLLEMKIPFAALRFKPKDNKAIMNISATRQVQHNNEFLHFPQVPQTVVDAVRKASFKQPVVFENIKPSRLLYITPSLSTGLIRSGYTTATRREFRPSLDIKYGLTPTVTADVTLNTDFSQAEVDDQQFNLSRFSLFYPEKRLFFQEQAGLFEFKLGSISQLFYSRVIGLRQGQIIPIIGGVRLTGNVAGTDIGLMNIQTAGASINDSTRIGPENFTIARTRNRVWNPSSYIGTMITARNGNQHTNTAAGVDAVIKVKGQHYFMGAASATFDKANKRSAVTGRRINMMWDLRKQDNVFYTIQYNYSGKDFNPGLGFVDRNNFHNAAAVVSFGKFARERKGLLRHKKIALSNDAYWSASTGRLESHLSYLALSGATFTEHYFNLRVQGHYESLDDTLDFGNNVYIHPGRYSFVQAVATYEAPEYLKVRFPLVLSYGSFYDGTRLSFSVTPAWSINKYFELSTGYTLERLRFSSRNIRSSIHLAKIGLQWAFNLHISGQVQLQYNNVVNKTLVNGRFRYHFSDGHDFYLVYNQTYYSQRFKQSPPLPVFEQQQFLLKYLYTFH